MKKIILTLALIIALACVFTACNKTPDNSSNPNENQSNTNTTCEHVWETVTTNPTCTTEGYDTMTCTICKESVETNKTEKLEHTYATTYMMDDDYHWFKCIGCKAIKGNELHTLDDEGVCTVCDLPITPTPGVIYELSDDETYAIVTGYEGTATKVKIAEEYEGVPVKIVCDDAFLYKNITSVVIPNSVTSIGVCAFYECSNLTSVVIGNSVTSIGEYAFEYCSSLTSVLIPDSVTNIDDGAFSNCSSLSQIIVDNGNNNYSSIDGNLYSKDAAILIQYAIGKTDSEFCILNSVASISYGAFSACSNLTSIVIGNSVTSIGYFAFYGCSSLTSIVIPDSVTSIGTGAFSNCFNLNQIIVDNGNNNYSSIDGNLYSKDATILIQYAPGKTDSQFCIPNSVTSIGDVAFEYCSNLTSVVIPDSVTSIGDFAFLNCSSFTSIVIPDSVTSIGDNVFLNCLALTSVTIGNGVTSIVDQAFIYCSSLTSVVIGNSVTSIGKYAFHLCYRLTDVYYTGSEEEWAEIEIDSIGNEHLTNATIHYNYIPEE